MDLKKIFGMLDQDNDGDTDLNDIMSLVKDPEGLTRVLNGDGSDKEKAGLDSLLTNAATGIAKGENNNALQQLSQAGISVDSLGGLLGGLLGKDTSTPANKDTLDTVLQSTLSKLSGKSGTSKNQGNQLLDIIVKVVGSKVATDVVGKVIKSFMGNMMSDVKTNGITQGGQEVDVMGDLGAALKDNNVDDQTSHDIMTSILNKIKG